MAKLKEYSGPYDRLIEYVSEIADVLDERRFRTVLKEYGADIKRHSALYHQTVYQIFPVGTDPEETEETRYIEPYVLKALCDGLESGEITIETT